MICSSAAHRARVSALQGIREELKMTEDISSMNLSDFCTNLAQSGLSGKMFLIYCESTTGEILELSYPKLQNSGIALAGECWTLDTSESPSIAVDSTLSDFMETGEHLQRHCLTADAIEGMVRRAEEEGRTVPEWIKSLIR
jgi:hypothetical protein